MRTEQISRMALLSRNRHNTHAFLPTALTAGGCVFGWLSGSLKKCSQRFYRISYERIFRTCRYTCICKNGPSGKTVLKSDDWDEEVTVSF